MLPVSSDIRVRPDIDMKKMIRIRFRLDPNWDPDDSDPVSKKKAYRKVFFQKQTLRKLKRVILYRWLNYISLLHASVIELICISSVKIKHLPWLAHFVHVTNLHLFTFKLWNKHFRNATLYLCCKIKNFTTKLSTLWLAVLLIISLKYFFQFLKTRFWLRLVYTHPS